MNVEEAVWYVVAAYAVVLVALLLLFALLARRLVRLTQRVNALRGDAGQGDESALDTDGTGGLVEATPDGGDAARPDAAVGNEAVGPGTGAVAASTGRDVVAGDGEGRDDRPPGET